MFVVAELCAKAAACCLTVEPHPPIKLVRCIYGDHGRPPHTRRGGNNVVLPCVDQARRGDGADRDAVAVSIRAVSIRVVDVRLGLRHEL